MNLVMDERLKHRLIGIAVIVSLGVIFIPALMKNSSHYLANRANVAVSLPAKPVAPIVTHEDNVFKTIKVAKVELPTVNEHEVLQSTDKEVVKPSSPAALPSRLVTLKTNTTPAKPLIIVHSAHTLAKNSVKTVALLQAKKSPTHPLKATTNNVQLAQNKKMPKIKSKKEIYAVQLASFSNLANAQSLINRLKNKGYKAHFITIPAKKGPVYKVFAGNSSQKNDMIKLKNQLAYAMQLQGFIVNTGVS